jgi:hypothetical protein
MCPTKNRPRAPSGIAQIDKRNNTWDKKLWVKAEDETLTSRDIATPPLDRSSRSRKVAISAHVLPATAIDGSIMNWVWAKRRNSAVMIASVQRSVSQRLLLHHPDQLSDNRAVAARKSFLSSFNTSGGRVGRLRRLRR